MNTLTSSMIPTEILRKQMMAAGKRLTQAMDAELQLNLQNAEEAENEDTLNKWRELRREVERLAEYYANSIEQYREAVQEAFIDR